VNVNFLKVKPDYLLKPTSSATQSTNGKGIKRTGKGDLPASANGKAAHARQRQQQQQQANKDNPAPQLPQPPSMLVPPLLMPHPQRPDLARPLFPLAAFAGLPPPPPAATPAAPPPLTAAPSAPNSLPFRPPLPPPPPQLAFPQPPLLPPPVMVLPVPCFVPIPVPIPLLIPVNREGKVEVKMEDSAKREHNDSPLMANGAEEGEEEEEEGSLDLTVRKSSPAPSPRPPSVASRHARPLSRDSSSTCPSPLDGEEGEQQRHLQPPSAAAAALEQRRRRRALIMDVPSSNAMTNRGNRE